MDRSVRNVDENNCDNKIIGKKIIETAVNLDESLVELLKIEIRMLKQLTKSSDTFEELQKTNNLVRSIIIAIMLTDEKIKTGLDLYIGHYNH
jgi:hypothetical protein